MPKFASYIISRPIVSAIIALGFLAITIWVSNWQISVSAEKAMLQRYEIFKQWALGVGKQYLMADSIIQIDVHYDKQVVMEHNDYDEELLRGKVAITDRDKLLRLLQYLKKTNNYRYILLDVFFDKSVSQPSDSLLFQLMASMPRLVIPEPRTSLADTCLSPKVGIAQYSTTVWESDFVKYPYIAKGEKSMAVKMYEELTKRHIQKIGPFYRDDWCFMRSSAILTYDLLEDENVRDEHLFLGMSLVGDSVNSFENLALLDNPEFAKDKYVLIGDFEDDVHNTYIGEMSGILVNFNAYLSLLNGYHKVSLWMMFILFCAFWFLVLQTLSHSTFAGMFMWFGYPFYLIIVFLLTYEVFHQVYDILAATILFYALQNMVECYRNKEKIIRWKNKTIQKYKAIWKSFLSLKSLL